MRKIAVISLLILIFTIPWETAITIGAIGTLTRLIGLAAAGIWIFSVLVQGKIRKPQLFHLILLVFMLYNIASIFWTLSIEHTLERVQTNIQIIIFSWMLWDLIATPGSFRAGMQVFVLGGYVAVASSILNFISGQQISITDSGRFTGAGQNAVEFAVILSLSLPIAWHLALTQKDGRGAGILKIANFAFIPSAIFAILLTASRTALIAVIPVLIYMAGTVRQLKPVYRFTVFAVFIIAIFFGKTLVPDATLNRLGTINASISTLDLGGRTDLWEESIAIFQQHPLFGIGSGALSSPSQLGTFAHNTFLSILTELGIVGFLLFIAVFVIIFMQAIQQPKPFAILSLTIFSTWIIGVFSLTWEYSKPTWFFLNLIILSAGISEPLEITNEESTISENSHTDSHSPTVDSAI